VEEYHQRLKAMFSEFVQQADDLSTQEILVLGTNRTTPVADFLCSPHRGHLFILCSGVGTQVVRAPDESPRGTGGGRLPHGRSGTTHALVSG